MSKLLVTAFEAFGDESINPAKLALERASLPDTHKLFLPVEYEKAAEIVLEAIRADAPKAVISIGQAGGRRAVTPEKNAVNERNAASPDSAGRVCTHEPIVPGGPERLLSSFGAKEISAALTKAGLCAEVSESAGTYVCNDVMYSVLYALRNTSIPAGFIHVPYCKEQLKAHPEAFGMELNEITRAIEIAVSDVCKRHGL